MKRLLLLLMVAALASIELSAQSFAVYQNNGNVIKYPADLVSAIDYTSYQDGIVVCFNIGGGEFIDKSSVDSICFYNDERDCEILAGAPNVQMQFNEDYSTVNLEVNEPVVIRALAARGDYPLDRIAVSLDGEDVVLYPEGRGKDVCYLYGHFSLDKEAKKLLTFTVYDEDGNESSSAIWLNTIKLSNTPTSVPDCFVYYPGSSFHFWQHDGDNTQGKASWWEVTDYDHSTGIATIKQTQENGSTTELQLRRNNVTGALEKVSGGTYYNLTDRNKEFYFLNGYKTKEPSSLLGDMEDKITYKDEGYGVYSVQASEVYHQNSQDRYGWGKDLYNSYRTDLGYTGTSWTSYDNNAGPSASFRFYESLLEYYIERPDGTYLYKKADLPPAPVITSAGTSQIVKDPWTMAGGMINIPEYSFEFAGTTDLIDFTIWTYDPVSQQFTKGPPSGMSTYVTYTYNDKYKKVPVFHDNVPASDRSFNIRPSSGWNPEYHYGPHFMVLTARNPAGYSIASNMFYFIINEYGSLIEYSIFTDEGNKAPLRSANAVDTPIHDQIIDARNRLIEQLNSQPSIKLPASKHIPGRESR